MKIQVISEWFVNISKKKCLLNSEKLTNHVDNHYNFHPLQFCQFPINFTLDQLSIF